MWSFYYTIGDMEAFIENVDAYSNRVEKWGNKPKRFIENPLWYESEVATIPDYVDSIQLDYYESRKRELKIRLMNEDRCDERLKGRVEESTCLTYTLGCTTKQT